MFFEDEVYLGTQMRCKVALSHLTRMPHHKHSGEPKEEEAKKALVSFRGGSTPQKRLENPPGLANTKTSQMKI